MISWSDVCQRKRFDGPTPCLMGDGCDCMAWFEYKLELVRWLFRHHYWSKFWS